MTHASFFTRFDLLADQPDAVTKMRKLILQLAVQGRLAKRSPGNSPPKLKLGAVIELISGQHLIPGEYNKDQKGIPYLTGPADFGPKFPTASRWTGTPKVVALKGDVLLTVKGAGVGKTNMVKDDKLAISRQLMAVRSKTVDSSFIDLSLRAAFDDFQAASNGIAIPGISREDVLNYEAWIPPLAEQRRIVAKVDELMALCDELEQRQQARQHARGLLQQSALHHLLAAREPATFAGAWQRVRDHFHLLHDTPDAIPQLRQAILQLAVQGRLVPQNPKDEQVGALLERVQKERLAIKDCGDHRIPDCFEPVAESEHPWEIPPQWAWRRLAELVLFIDYRGKTPTKTKHGVRLLTAKNIRKGFISIEPEEFIAEDSYKSWMTRGIPRNGDVLFTTEAPLGNAAVLDINERVALAQRTINFRLFGGIDPKFMVHSICSPLYQSFLEEHATGMTATGIKSGKLKFLPFPLPPLAEQKRIASRVEELLRWCDTLEAQLHQTRTLGAHLLDSTLHHLLAA